jgi:serine/threonine protein kinase
MHDVKKTDRLIGQILGGYKILSKIGAGGMGAVYQAQDIELEKMVAVKVLPPHAINDEDAVERFRREAKVAAKLDHPNIVPIFRFGEEQGFWYLVMRWVKGESLADRLMREPRLPFPQAVTIAHGVAKGLECAHREGLVHRDIKPANILLSDRDEVLIADFGLAKQSGGDGQGLTATGMIMGTPDYMAPEQCEGFPDIDGQADLYSLGLVFYTMLTGNVPSEGKTPLQVIMNRVRKAVPPPRIQNPAIPFEINDLIMGLLENDRSKRLGNASDLIDRIENLTLFKNSGSVRLHRRTVLTAEDPTVVMGSGEERKPSILLKARLLSKPVDLSSAQSTKTAESPKITAKEKKSIEIRASEKGPIQIHSEVKKGVPTGGTKLKNRNVLKARRVENPDRPKQTRKRDLDREILNDGRNQAEERSNGSSTTAYIAVSMIVMAVMAFMCFILLAALGA